jgi:hypothetical protein
MPISIAPAWEAFDSARDDSQIVKKSLTAFRARCDLESSPEVQAT